MNKIFLSACVGVTMLFTSSVNAQTVLINEQFDTEIPSTYTMISNDEATPHANVAEYTSPWIWKLDPTDSTNGVASSTSYFTEPAVANRWLITPSIAIGGYGSKITWKSKSHDASFSEKYMVLISTTDTEIASFQDTIWGVLNDATEWTSFSVDLIEAGYANENIHVAFVLNTADGFKFYLDDLYIETDNALSIPLKKQIDFTVYPNPTADILTISTSIAFEKLVIRSINGEIVKSSTDNQISVAELSSGVYFAELIYADGVVSKRFIKK